MTAAPAVAQSRADVDRWQAAQARYRAETDLYNRERDRCYRISSRDGYAPGPGTYAPFPPPPPGGDDQRGYDRGYPAPQATDHDAAREYREDPRYQGYQMSASDQAYRASDGRRKIARLQEEASPVRMGLLPPSFAASLQYSSLKFGWIAQDSLCSP